MVGREHDVSFPDHPQHQRDCLHHELGEGEYTFRLHKSTMGSHSPPSPSAPETASCSTLDQHLVHFLKYQSQDRPWLGKRTLDAPVTQVGDGGRGQCTWSGATALCTYQTFTGFFNPLAQRLFTKFQHQNWQRRMSRTECGFVSFWVSVPLMIFFSWPPSDKFFIYDVQHPNSQDERIWALHSDDIPELRFQEKSKTVQSVAIFLMLTAKRLMWVKKEQRQSLDS